MTVTITNPNGTNHIGLGITIDLSSTVSTPPSGSHWNISVGTTSGFSVASLTATIPVTFWPSDSLELGQWVGGQTWAYVPSSSELVEEGPAYVSVQVNGPTGTMLDSGTATMEWHILTMQNQFLMHQIQFWTATEGAGSTAISNIQTTVNAIKAQQMIPVTDTGGTTEFTIGEYFATKLITLLTTASLTTGPTSGSFSHALLSGETGIIIHIDTIPDWYGFSGPGNGYYEPALAKCRVYRGGDVMFDMLIHEPDTLIYPIPGAWNVSPSSFFSIQVIPPGMTVAVDFNDGVFGEVSVMLFP